MKSAQTKSKKTKPAHPKAAFSFRHNVLPPLMGILMFAATLGLLNWQWIEAQVQYYVLPTKTVTVKPVSMLSLDPNAPAELIIPSLGIDVPFITDQPSYDPELVEQALRDGIVHYGTTAMPGQVGNVVALGHSSGALWTAGHYKYAFTLLNKIQDKALVYIDYKGARYIYRVTSTEVVLPNNVGVLQPTKTPQLTMITCTPVGVSSHRLVVHATQISPAPEKATAPTGKAKPVTSVSLPQ